MLCHQHTGNRGHTTGPVPASPSRPQAILAAKETARSTVALENAIVYS